MEKRIASYDTTLRDGCQARGISLSAEDKWRISQRLDEMGIDYIEGGWPNPTNPRDLEFFERARRGALKHSKLTAFGSTRRADNPPEKDPVLETLLRAEAPVVAIFGKSWDLHVQKVLKVSPAENLAMIESSVRHLKEAGREVVFDAEHYFDGYRGNPKYALETLRAAQEGGADWVVLCDTNGGSLLNQVEEGVKAAKEVLSVPFGMHMHNDSGLAVAGTLAGVMAGATQVQGTINGYGERCGNANLCTVIPILELKMGCRCIGEGKLRQIAELSRYVAELANVAHEERQPFVGAAAFSHKAGMHIDGIVKERRSFEHVPPESVGNHRELLVSDQAGTRAVVEMLKDEFPELEKGDPGVRKVLEALKKLEHQGWQFEAADASFKLLARKILKSYNPIIELERFRVLVEKRADGETDCEAVLKVRVNGRPQYTAATGDGPVNALDNALRKALGEFEEELGRIALTDYKVRVLDEKSATAARVRVLIDTKDEEDRWGTVGASENIIEASWQALVDSIEYGLQKAMAKGKRLEERP